MILEVLSYVDVETSILNEDATPKKARRVTFAMYANREDMQDGIAQKVQPSRLFPESFRVTQANGNPVRLRGEYMTFETTPYEIGANVVSKFSTLVLEGENAVEVANGLLKRNNACVVINGKPTIEGFGTKSEPEPEQKMANQE